MAERNNLESTVAALFKGFDSVMTTKTVVGEPVKAGKMTLIPLAEVSFGMGATNFTGSKKNNGGGGMGGSMKPTAMLQISEDGSVRMISLKNQDALSKLMDMAPDIWNKLTGKDDKTDDDIVIEE